MSADPSASAPAGRAPGASPSPLLPVFLKLDGARALVVGGGAIGARKARELLDAGARVTAVSLAFVDAFPVHERLERVQRPFAPGDSRGAVVVFACTGAVEVDDAVAVDAREHRALVNVVDRPEACAFYSGAVVTRGRVVVAVGTAGTSPTLARIVRDRIDQVLPASLGVLADVLGRARPRLLARYPSMPERIKALEPFVERAWWRFFAGPGRVDVGADLERAVERAVETELLAVDASDAAPGAPGAQAAPSAPGAQGRGAPCT